MHILLDETTGGGGTMYMYIAIFVIIILMFVFTSRPQRKEQKRRKELYSMMEPGDTVLTSSGFYGTLIDIDEETVIVEFGNNRNCRIPMRRDAIIQVEKANEGIEES